MSKPLRSGCGQSNAFEVVQAASSEEQNKGDRNSNSRERCFSSLGSKLQAIMAAVAADGHEEAGDEVAVVEHGRACHGQSPQGWTSPECEPIPETGSALPMPLHPKSNLMKNKFADAGKTEAPKTVFYRGRETASASKVKKVVSRVN